MNTRFNMDHNQDILSEQQFFEELVNRFFNQSSYFMHCINHEIEALVEDMGPDDDDYLLLGHLMDRLVESEDKIRELETLKEIPGFSMFFERLVSGVKYLREAELDSERMKIEIEKLAQSMFGHIVDALQNQETKSQLQNILGITPSEEEQQFEFEIDEPSSDEPEPPEPDFNLDRETEVQPSKDETDFVAEKGIDTDVENVGGYEDNSVTEGDGSSKIEEAAEFDPEPEIEREPQFESEREFEAESHPKPEPEPEPEKIINSDPVSEPVPVSSEPTSLVRAFETDSESHLAHLKKHLRALRENPQNWQRWQECDTLFDSIIASAMIYGFDGFEQVASKARRLISQVQNPDFDLSDAIAVLEESVDFLHNTITSDPERPDVSQVRELSRKLLSPPEATPPKDDSDPVKKNQSNEAKFKIPGEDDEEILNLVKEISQETNNPHAKPDGSPAVREVASPSPGDEFAKFQEQAKLYYVIIEEALNVIGKNREDAQAFEDLEIAASSLRDLVFKTKTEQLGEFPEFLLSIARNSLSTSYLLSEADHQLLIECFEQFCRLRNSDDLNNSEFAKDLELIKGLNGKIEMLTQDRDEIHSHFKERKSNSIEILGD